MFTDALRFFFTLWAKLTKKDFHIRVLSVGELRANRPTERPDVTDGGR